MNDLKFLLKELFTTLTREGILPITVEDYEVRYSQREYEAILLQVLQSLDMIADVTPQEEDKSLMAELGEILSETEADFFIKE